MILRSHTIYIDGLYLLKLFKLKKLVLSTESSSVKKELNLQIRGLIFKSSRHHSVCVFVFVKNSPLM